MLVVALSSSMRLITVKNFGYLFIAGRKILKLMLSDIRGYGLDTSGSKSV
jgi:hypothetical protein